MEAYYFNEMGRFLQMMWESYILPFGLIAFGGVTILLLLMCALSGITEEMESKKKEE
jgi:hypothetical protein